MKNRVYTIELEIDDLSAECDGEDIELWITDVLREGLPDSLVARVISFEENYEN